MSSGRHNHERRIVHAALLSAWESIPSPGSIVLAVSGGVDSMVLLEAAHAVAELKFESQRLIVAHVNHSLRGRESQGDERLVRERAKALGLAFRSRRLKWKEGERASQEACRRKREAFLASLMPADNDRLLFAHHLDDQAETVLFRLIRGTGLRGLKGMRQVSGKKLRPFLALRKSQLLAYAESCGLLWREDSSNAGLKYERNWIRRKLLPLVEERRPGFSVRLAALAEEAAGLGRESKGLESFEWSEAIRFCRFPSGAPSTRQLSEAFSLSRLHALQLRTLLGKDSGQCQAKGIRFTWSGGLLLVEKGNGFHPQEKKSRRTWGTCLGIWKASPGRALHAAESPREKKKLKSLKVPIFFRASLPLLSGPSGKSRALPLGREADGVTYQPSALGRWWLEGVASS